MAKGLNEFTIQQAYNYTAFGDWNYEELNLGTALGGYVSSSYITPNNSAKKVAIYPVPGQTVADADNLYIYLNDTISAASQSAEGDTMDATETALTIDDGSNYTVGDVILIDAELMYVSAVADDAGDGAYTPSTLTVVRGYGTSIGATHADNTLIWKIGTPGNHTASFSVNPIIKVGVDQLPFVLSGIILTGLNMWNTGAEDNANDDISILSFH